MQKFQVKLCIGAILLSLSNMSVSAMLHQQLGAPAKTMSDKPAWNLSIAPDGLGLPLGQGNATQGAKIFASKCSSCHGQAGIGASANTLVGEVGSLKSTYPEKTVNSYWPYATTLFDYIRRAMPPNAPFSLTADEVYALSAYILSIDAIIPTNLVINQETLAKVKMPNRNGFRSVYVANPKFSGILAYISNQLENTISVIDTEKNQVLTTIKVAGAPAGVTVGKANHRVYVSTPENSSIAIIDTITQKLLTTIVVGGAPLGIAIGGKDNYVYIADWYTNKVHILDTKQQQLVATILVGKSPSGMVLSADNNYLFVANRLSNSISKINLNTRLVEKTTTVGTHPFGLALDDKFLYSANVISADISVLDADTLTLVGRIELEQDSLPYALTLALGDSRLLVTHQGDSYVGVIDTKTRKYIASIEVGDKPEGISTHPKDDRLVYVANWFDDTVSLIDVSKLTTIKTIKVGKGARSFGKFIAP